MRVRCRRAGRAFRSLRIASLLRRTRFPEFHAQGLLRLYRCGYGRVQACHRGCLKPAGMRRTAKEAEACQELFAVPYSRDDPRTSGRDGQERLAIGQSFLLTDEGGYAVILINRASGATFLS